MTKSALCPKCKKDLGARRVDLSNTQRVNTYCPHCHAKLLIMHGEGKVKVVVQK